jgi:hypothetical protein
MDLEVTYNNGEIIKVGDEVRIIKLTDDSGDATTLYGVEPQLNAWVEVVYLEEFTGVVTFNKKTLMYVIKGKYTEIALSTVIRYDMWVNSFERVDDDQVEEICKEFNIKDTEFETLINFIEKINTK